MQREALEAQYVTNVATAVMAAQDFDRSQCARGVAIVALVIAGDDPAARTALAQLMLKLASELDPDLAGASLQ